MTEVSFVDTNLLVYARDPRQERKQPLAADLMRRLWQQRAGRTSVQVLTDYYATLTRKLKPVIDADSAWEDVRTLMAWNPQPIDSDLLQSAREIERRYGTSWWDALIVAAAQAQRCHTLLSEEFQDGMVFEQLTVRNPFTSSIQEPLAEYHAVRPRERHRPRGRPVKAVQ